MRSKEEAHDYRYFPDPDLLPLVLEETFIDEVRSALPELPTAKRERFQSAYGLGAYDAAVLTQSRDLADYYESAHRAGAPDSKLLANWILGEVLAKLNRDHLEIDQVPVPASMLALLLVRIADGTLSGPLAKTVFETLWAGEGSVDEIIDARGLRQVSDTGALEQVIEDTIAAHATQWTEYCAGRDKLLGFFVGQVMQATQGRANPQTLNALIQKRRERSG